MTPLSCFRTTAVTAAPLSYRLFQLTTSRFYGSVAAAEPLFDPNNYYSYYQAESDWDQHRDSLRSITLPDTEGRERRRGVQWAFIGSPRAKKHVYAEMLSKLLEVPRIAMSSLVRQDLSPRSSLHKQIANAVNRGEVVSEDIIFGLLSKRLEDGYYRGEIGFILDGIPRSRIQAEILDQLAEIDLVVNFKCADNFIVMNREQATGRLLPETEKTSSVSSWQCTCRDVARTSDCIASTAYKCCLFFTRTNEKIPFTLDLTIPIFHSSVNLSCK